MAVCLGGGVGAVLRLCVVQVVHYWVKGTFPVGTCVVNALGCFLIGLCWVQLEYVHAPQWVKLMIITGGIGAFTTFSTYMIDLLFLLEKHAVGNALLYGVLSNGIGFLFLVVGFKVGRFFIYS